MDPLFWIIYTIKRFFIVAFLWVLAHGLQSMVTKIQLLLYNALCPALLSQSDYKVAEYVYAHVLVFRHQPCVSFGRSS